MSRTTRNHDIMRLRGILPQLVNLIPDDIKKQMRFGSIEILDKISTELMEAIDNTAKRNAIKRIKKTKSFYYLTALTNRIKFVKLIP